MKQIKFGNREIGNYREPYIIAEIGANHNGNMDLAKEMIISAKEAGADCVKFQSWTPKSLISKEEYQNNQVYNDSKKKHFGSLKEMVTKYALTDEQHRELKSFCDKNNIEFASSPFSVEEARLLNDIGVSFFKIASMDINYIDFLKEVASFKKPMIISTGMATIAEIETAVNACKEAGNDQIVLLHCISIYPPEYEDIHLNNISMLRNTFNMPIGFSDHTIGTAIPLASAALGACVIEKHFTLDKDLPGWDHQVSANPMELKIICEESKNIAKSLGNYQRTVSEAEELKKEKFRRSLVVKRDLKKGDILKKEDLTAKRPGTFIAPDKMEYVLGRELNTDISEDAILKWENLY
ncbi:N-acetylneuraminate synthase [Christiangramia gaetbulicola]|uniref:N-acetylneuraminate synthase n=1 Tax=Christiangramia gaetbulicola TaxID=703340 RepID=A0A2T6AFN7_9FLAO|nr:N-acetylneuraminate synthase family protein [Christiangramia gaetbulicola]PTX42607.1 N-acetylneuraminate synthase [Christiangramia gaetbulicola]